MVPYRRIRKPHREGAIIDQPDSFGGPIYDSQWISRAPIAVGVVGWKKSHTRQVVHAV